MAKAGLDFTEVGVHLLRVVAHRDNGELAIIHGTEYLGWTLRRKRFRRAHGNDPGSRGAHHANAVLSTYTDSVELPTIPLPSYRQGDTPQNVTADPPRVMFKYQRATRTS
jgi:hypothetical protein